MNPSSEHKLIGQELDSNTNSMRKGILNGTVKILHNDFIHINWTCYADFMNLQYNMSEVKNYHLEESTHSFGCTVKVKKQSNKNSASFFPQ